MSLAALFSEVSKRNRTGRLIQHERIHLATLLAKAILQFYHTPWLKNPLRSRDILFYNINIPTNPLLELPRLANPYVNTFVKPSMQTSIMPFGDLVQESLTFSLGVVLLELAF